MLLTSFPPVSSPQTSVVILGSMPGQLSLKVNQYYAAPQNLFWPTMSQLFGIARELPYAERLALLVKAGVGLWDVLKHCDREGSLDASIDQATEVPNDFGLLFEQCPAVKAICFNGQKAEKAFRRHVIQSLPPQILSSIDIITLPSTSPANRTKTQLSKVEEWKALLRYTTQ